MMMTVMMDEEEFIVILRIKAEESLPTDGMLPLGYVLQGWAEKWSLGCVNSHTVARGSQEAT